MERVVQETVGACRRQGASTWSFAFWSCGSGVVFKNPEQRPFSKYVLWNTGPDRSAAKGFHGQISLGNPGYPLPPL